MDIFVFLFLLREALEAGLQDEDKSLICFEELLSCFPKWLYHFAFLILPTLMYRMQSQSKQPARF